MSSLSRQNLIEFVESLEELDWEFLICVLGEEVNGVRKPLSFCSAHIKSEDTAREMLVLLKDEIRKKE